MKEEKVSDIITERVVSIDKNTNLVEAAKVMVSEDTGWVLILEGGALKGILTERDIMFQANLKGDALESQLVKDVMSTEVINANPSTKLSEVTEILATYAYNRLPVLDGEKVVGVVSRRNLCHQVCKKFFKEEEEPHEESDCPFGETVGDVMTKEVRTILPDKPIKEAIQQMCKAMGENSHFGVGSIIVENGAQIAGILTERDVIKCVADKKDLETTTVQDSMSKDVKTIYKDLSVCNAMSIMDHGHFRHLPVIDKEKRLSGIVSYTDMIRTMQASRVFQ
ncbi:MAG: CBS domain-containing protein [Candidatus Altiarchaeota archaeon]